VGVGGLVRASLTMRDPKLWRYLTELHARARDASTVLHGFGLSSWPAIKSFPWFSVDSSAPGSGYRYGRVMAYDPFADSWRTWRASDRVAWHRWGWLVREYGMTPAEFALPAPANRAALIAIAARSWSRAAATLDGRRVYVSDTSTSAEKNAHRYRETMKAWEHGNQWATRVYVTDGAFGSTEEGGSRLGAFERSNRLYITDPHPSASKNRERIAAWEAGNRWAGAQGAPGAA
jgi:hypothetical protein